MPKPTKDKSMLHTVTVKADNPYFSPSTPAEQKAIKVERSLRGDRLAALLHRKHIGDAEYRAGRDYQALCEAAEVGNVGALDPFRDPVDGGGRLPSIMSDPQLKAIKDLNRIHAKLGEAGTAVVRCVLLEQMTYPEIARRMYDGGSQKTVRYVGRRVRETLESLSAEFGYG